MAPGHAGTQIEIFRDAEPELGFLRASAKADRDNKVTGGLGNDFRATPDIPVIAQRWLARGMEVDEKVPGLGFGRVIEDDDTATSTVSFQSLTLGQPSGALRLQGKRRGDETRR